jgi:Fe-Mn family superoxide dismutase
MYTNSMVLRRPVEFSSQIVDSAGLAFAASPSRYPAEFGNGWAWLVMDGKGLKIVKTNNAETPMTQGLKPLL